MKNKKQFWVLIGSVLIILTLVAWSKVAALRSHSATTGMLPGMQTGNAPWVAETSRLDDRLKVIGLPALSEEGMVLHTHQHLDIVIDGKPVPIPSGIGTNERIGFITSIHTHDTSGVIHVESPTIETFTLGQFFDIWGVRFTADTIGGYTSQENKTLRVFVNGKEHVGDPRTLALDAHQEIVIVYGTDKETPNPIPEVYGFPEGE